MNIEWETPQDFFDNLNKEFNFTLDVAADYSNKKCKAYFRKEFDGLKQDWSKDICWMNPPYDRSIDKWMKKAYETSKNGGTVVCLIQGRSTDTKWWHDYAMKASEIRFIKKRLYFVLNGKRGMRPNISSVIIIFRPYCEGPPITRLIDTKGNKLG